VDGVAIGASRFGILAGEVAKVPAFLRRDLLVAWSYRAVFISDFVGLAFMITIFYYVGQMLDPEGLPRFNGVRVTYMEFVIIGIVLGAFIQIGLARVATALRNEQAMGTLESLLLTPTATTTIQLGSAAYDLIYVPLRTGIVLLVGAIAFGLGFQPVGIAPALAVLVLFIPFVWGLGLAAAGAVLTFKRGGNAIHIGSTLMLITSGAYFPLELFPRWVEAVAQFNPMALAVDGMRKGLLGGASFAGVASHLLLLGAMSALSLALGAWAFRLGLAREQSRGTLGLY
jgi:ABC-2 type transport system permease protein